MARDLLIFLNRKLISCDTVVPLTLELKARAPSAAVYFIVADRATVEAIRMNKVLMDAIASIGKLVDLGRMPTTDRWLHRARLVPLMAQLLTRVALDRAVMLHFKALNDGLLAWFYRLNPERTYFCQNDIYGFTKLMYQVTYHTRDDPPPIARIPNARHLIAFNSEWALLDAPACRRLVRFEFGATRLRKTWLDFVRGRADAYFAEEFGRAGLSPSNEIFAVMLGTFDALSYLRERDSVMTRLAELLRVLADRADGRAIFLKPHIVTDLDILRRMLAEIRHGRFVVSHLHPMVLAQRARLFAATYYSSTIADAAALGVPTIEYTDYSDETLTLTAGGSMRPEFVDCFLNGDPHALDSAVARILAMPRRPQLPGHDGDPSGLLKHLGGLLNDDAYPH